jgi:hypothetical protein
VKLRTSSLTTPPTSGLRGVTPKMYAITFVNCSYGNLIEVLAKVNKIQFDLFLYVIGYGQFIH